MKADITKQFSADVLKFNPPHFSESVLHAFLQNQYGMDGDFKSLVGERDQNIRLTTSNGKQYVLKIAGPDELDETVDFQIKSLLHLQKTDPGLSVPVQITTKSGEQAAIIKDDSDQPHWVRLVSYIQGEPLDLYDHLDFDSIKEMGRITGRLCAALKGFKHTASKNFMPWDGMNGLIFSAELREKYMPDDFKTLAEIHLQRLEKEGMPRLLALPHQVIHHDGHAGNIMCEAGNPAVITGVIDFGDLIDRPIVMDISIVLTSVISQNSDILTATTAMLDGYSEYTFIPDEQLALLYDAVAISFIMAVQLLSYRAKHHTDDPEKIRQEDLAGTVEAARKFLKFDRTQFTTHIMRTN